MLISWLDMVGHRPGSVRTGPHMALRLSGQANAGRRCKALPLGLSGQVSRLSGHLSDGGVSRRDLR